MDQMRLLGGPKLIKLSSERSYAVQSDYGRLALAKVSGRVQLPRPSVLSKQDLDRPLLTEPPPRTYTATEVLRWNPSEPPSFEPDGLIYRFPLDAIEYSKLVDQLEANGQDKTWPRYQYDARNGMGIVQLMPSAIHGNVHSLINNAIVESLASQPQAAKARFFPRTGVDLDLRDFSRRCPDFELVERTASNKVTVLVLECGFSQSYESLLGTVHDWFRGTPSIRMVILVDVQEEPRYWNPLKDFDADIIIERFQDARIDDVIESVPGQSWAGYMVRGENFVGALSCYLECWIRGLDDGPMLREPRHQFVPAKANEVPLQLRFGELSDFSPTRDLMIELDWDTMREMVQEGAKEQAHSRARKVVREALKSLGQTDGKFRPSTLY